MILINPTTNTEVETFTDEAAKHLLSKGYKPKDEKPKRTTKRSTKKGQ